MYLVIKTTNFALIWRSNGGSDSLITNWRQYRAVVRDFLAEECRRPYPPEIALNTDQTSKLLNRLGVRKG